MYSGLPEVVLTTSGGQKFEFKVVCYLKNRLKKTGSGNVQPEWTVQKIGETGLAIILIAEQSGVVS